MLPHKSSLLEPYTYYVHFKKYHAMQMYPVPN
jgi:hypothetical protein